MSAAVALAAVLLLSQVSDSTYAAPAGAGSSSPARPPVPARPGDRGVFLLQSGATLVGRLVSSGPEGDVVELPSGERWRLAAGSVVGRVGAIAPPGAEPAPAPAGSVRVRLADGRTLGGELVAHEGGVLRLRTGAGEVAIPDVEIREVRFAEEVYRGPADPGRGRHLHAPSALPLAAGELVVGAGSVSTLLVEAGLWRWVGLSAGLAHPVAYGTPAPESAYFADLTLRAAPLRWLHAAGGARATQGRGGFSSVLFAAVTATAGRGALTLYAGPAAPEAGRLGRFDEVVAAAAGTLRVHRHAAFVAEAWVTPRSESPEALGALAGRLLTSRLFLDLGVAATTAGEGFPWIAAGWRHDRRRP
jgi:hypothetical protein